MLGIGNLIPTKRRKSGFTLVELMASVAIVGILGVSVVNSYRVFVVKARRIEAKMNIKVIHALHEGFRAGSGGVDLASAYFYVGLLSDLNTSPSACNTPNALGFAVSDCRRVRYTYLFTPNSPGMADLRFFAVEKGTVTPARDAGPCAGNLLWWQKTGVYNPSRIYSISDCAIQPSARMVNDGCTAARSTDYYALNISGELTYQNDSTEQCN